MTLRDVTIYSHIVRKILFMNLTSARASEKKLLSWRMSHEFISLQDVVQVSVVATSTWMYLSGGRYMRRWMLRPWTFATYKANGTGAFEKPYETRCYFCSETHVYRNQFNTLLILVKHPFIIISKTPVFTLLWNTRFHIFWNTRLYTLWNTPFVPTCISQLPGCSEATGIGYVLDFLPWLTYTVNGCHWCSFAICKKDVSGARPKVFWVKTRPVTPASQVTSLLERRHAQDAIQSGGVWNGRQKNYFSFP